MIYDLNIKKINSALFMRVQLRQNAVFRLIGFCLKDFNVLLLAILNYEGT